MSVRLIAGRLSPFPWMERTKDHMLSEGDSTHFHRTFSISTGWFCLATMVYEGFGVRSTKHYAFPSRWLSPDTKPGLSLPESMHGG